MGREGAVDLPEVAGRRLGGPRNRAGDGEAGVELRRRDRDAVEVRLLAEDQPEGDDRDRKRLDLGGGQVAGRVGHDRDPATRDEAAQVLLAHVLDLRLLDAPEPPGHLEDVLGAVDVEVQADAAPAADDGEGVPERRRRAAEGLPVDPVSRDEHLGAETEEDRRPRLADPRLHDLARNRGSGLEAGLPSERPEGSLEKVDEALGARVDDACGLQDRQLFRRPRQRLARSGERGREKLGEIARLPGPSLDLSRPVPDDGENRPLARLSHRAAGRLGRRPDGPPEPLGSDAACSLQRLGEPFQELGEDGPGVPAGAEERLVRRAARHVFRVRGGRSADARRHAVQRRREIRAGVVVRDREDVDPVQRLPLGQDGARPREERACKPPAVEIADPGRRHRISL